MKKFPELMRLTIDGVNLPDEIYEEYDISGLDDILYDIDDSEKLLELVGHDFSEDSVIYDIECKNGKSLWEIIEKHIKNYPLCKGTKVELINKEGMSYESFQI